MIEINENQIIAMNENLLFQLNYSDGLKFLGIINNKSCKNLIEKEVQQELFVITYKGRDYPSSAFRVKDTRCDSDRTQELITISLRSIDDIFNCRICLLHNGETIRLFVQMSSDFDGEPSDDVQITLPFISNINENNKIYYPQKPLSNSSGVNTIFVNPALRLPFWVFDKDMSSGFGINMPGGVHDFMQCKNNDFYSIKSINELRNKKSNIRLNSFITSIIDFEFYAINSGWEEAFCNYRDNVRKSMVLDEYKRKELEWYKDIILYHFTYVYGREVYNYQNNQLDVKKLLDDGEEFGGYDAILLWHQYPRLGIDRRTQWEFFEDFPIGLEGIKQVTNSCHKRGVKVLIPYKPWDIASSESMDSALKELLNIIIKTDIDGIFFDTMASIPENFRKEIDKIKPSIIFCCEIQPREIKYLENITSSWYQHSSFQALPNINLMRFILPEHITHEVARWSLDTNKDEMIKRAIFNGIGIVIWQDVFGTWLEYTDKQKLAIKTWKEILTSNKEIFFGTNPIPLVSTLDKDLYCNRFLSTDTSSTIYTIYNDSDIEFSGKILIHNKCVKKVEDCWNKTITYIDDVNESNILNGTIGAREVVVLKID